MRVYTPNELRRFLESVDAALTRRAKVVVIGGAAAALEYGVATGTRDIDTWTKVQNDLMVAVERARQATGLAVPFAQSGVADGPEDFESRLKRALPHLRRLPVMVPEKHILRLDQVHSVFDDLRRDASRRQDRVARSVLEKRSPHSKMRHAWPRRPASATKASGEAVLNSNIS
jgi:hypothetical protein